VLTGYFNNLIAIPDRLLDRWSRQAKACYFIGCRCSKCLLPEITETLKGNCKMKYVVLELVKKFGAPKRNEEN